MLSEVFQMFCLVSWLGQAPDRRCFAGEEIFLIRGRGYDILHGGLGSRIGKDYKSFIFFISFIYSNKSSCSLLHYL